jgi:hypothetical protein
VIILIFDQHHDLSSRVKPGRPHIWPQPLKRCWNCLPSDSTAPPLTSFVNEAIKPLQPQGLMGERDIHRRPFEACNIPPFDSSDKLHQRIAEISAAARNELLSIVPRMKTPVGTARGDARRLVQGKLSHLDTLAAELLKRQKARYPEPKDQGMKLMDFF